MKDFLEKHSTYSKGQTMMVLLVMVFSGSLAVAFGVVSPTVRAAGTVREAATSRQSYAAAESGIEDVFYRLSNGMSVDDEEELTIGDTVATTVTVHNPNNEKLITAIGDTNDVERTVGLNITAGNGFSFNYGVQVGAGGFDLDNGAGVIGNVYANGPITGGKNGSYITGTAISAGETGLISDVTVGQEGEGDAWAYTVTDSDIEGTLYCQVGAGNNQLCDTSRSDPETLDFPVDEDITTWETQAGEGTTIEGDLSISEDITTLGPVIITGDLNLSNSVELTLTGTVWVQGNINFSNNVEVRVDDSYGTDGEVFLSSGYIHLSNNVKFFGSGTEGSYIMLVTTSTCPSGAGCDGNNAIELDNNVGTVIMNAQNGTVFFSNNAGATSVVADTIALDNNATIKYDQGLINTNFKTGPAGGWVINSWEEQ